MKDWHPYVHKKNPNHGLDPAGRVSLTLGVYDCMANTPPDPPVKDRDTKKLVEDLCIALRDVGTSDYELPGGDAVQSHIEEVRKIHAELQRRGVDLGPRISQLSRESGWLMEKLLKDCLEFPKSLPYVKEADGIRRYFRCWLCAEREFTPGTKQFLLCEECLHRVLNDIRRRIPSSGVMLYRTYNEEKRCHHANSETVVATLEQNFDVFGGFCEQCILEELGRLKHKNQGNT